MVLAKCRIISLFQVPLSHSASQLFCRSQKTDPYSDHIRFLNGRIFDIPNRKHKKKYPLSQEMQTISIPKLIWSQCQPVIQGSSMNKENCAKQRGKSTKQSKCTGSPCCMGSHSTDTSSSISIYLFTVVRKHINLPSTTLGISVLYSATEEKCSRLPSSKWITPAISCCKWIVIPNK